MATGEADRVDAMVSHSVDDLENWTFRDLSRSAGRLISAVGHTSLTWRVTRSFETQNRSSPGGPLGDNRPRRLRPARGRSVR
jgi:hypothetical protein